MPSPVPTPVAAAIGLVPTVLDGVCRLPGKAVQLPVYAVSHALTTLRTARREYDVLAERGERLIARLRGTSFDEVEDVVEDALQGTPLARPYDAVEDALEDAGDTVTQLVRTGSSRARKAAGSASRSAGDTVTKAADTVEQAADRAGDAVEHAVDKVAETAGDAVEEVEEVADKAGDAVEDAVDTVGGAVDTAAAAVEDAADAAERQPKGAPTPKATEPDSTRIDTAASSDVVQTVERVSATVGGPVLDHDDLPLPDYDHLTLGSLRGRMRSLDVPALIQVRDYEKAHADRLPIVTMLDNRIAKLANDPTAPLSGSAPSAPVPAKVQDSQGGSKVSPGSGGPTLGTAPHGVPGNSQDPR